MNLSLQDKRFLECAGDRQDQVLLNCIGFFITGLTHLHLAGLGNACQFILGDRKLLQLTHVAGASPYEPPSIL